MSTTTTDQTGFQRTYKGPDWLFLQQYVLRHVEVASQSQRKYDIIESDHYDKYVV